MTDYGRTFKLNANTGDLSITSERIDMVKEGDKVQQDLRIIFQTVVGENILHRAMGFWSAYSDEDITIRNARKRIVNALAQYQYPLTLQEFKIDEDKANRAITIKLSVTLLSGVELEVHI